MTDPATFMTTLARKHQDAANADFAISYRSDARGFVGIFALPGDAHFRQCRTPSGELRWRATYQESEADASLALVDALQTLKANLD